MTDKAKPFLTEDQALTGKVLKKGFSWMDRAKAAKARVADLRLMLECVEQQLDYGQIDTAKKLVQATLATKEPE